MPEIRAVTTLKGTYQDGGGFRTRAFTGDGDALPLSYTRGSEQGFQRCPEFKRTPSEA
jgi:hypothetical protein